MDRWCYTYATLTVSSTIELPEWKTFSLAVHPGITDVTITTTPVTGPISGEPTHKITPDEYCLLLPQIGLFQASNGKTLEVRHLPEADHRKIRFFVLGTMWAALCYQRGMLAIHAGSVDLGHGAILFCAGPGKGKSTLTAFLATRGHQLISDDLCCLEELPQGQPVVYPSTQRLRLWKDTVQALKLDSYAMEKDFYRVDKYHIPWGTTPPTGPIPIKSIILLEWGPLELVRLNGKEALQNFVAASTYRGEVLHRMGAAGSYFERCLRLLAKVPVWQLTRPKDLATLDTVAGLIEQHCKEQLPAKYTLTEQA